MSSIHLFDITECPTKNIKLNSRYLWLMPRILATWEVKVRGIMV
jgi:hypothetical protein